MKCPACGSDRVHQSTRASTSIVTNWCTQCGALEYESTRWVVLGVTDGNNEDVIGFCAKKIDCATPDSFIADIIQEYGEYLQVEDVKTGWLVEYPNFNRICDKATPKGQEAWCIWP